MHLSRVVLSFALTVMTEVLALGGSSSFIRATNIFVQINAPCQAILFTRNASASSLHEVHEVIPTIKLKHNNNQQNDIYEPIQQCQHVHVNLDSFEALDTITFFLNLLPVDPFYIFSGLHKTHFEAIPALKVFTRAVYLTQTAANKVLTWKRARPLAEKLQRVHGPVRLFKPPRRDVFYALLLASCENALGFLYLDYRTLTFPEKSWTSAATSYVPAPSRMGRNPSWTLRMAIMMVLSITLPPVPQRDSTCKW